MFFSKKKKKKIKEEGDKDKVIYSYLIHFINCCIFMYIVYSLLYLLEFFICIYMFLKIWNLKY